MNKLEISEIRKQFTIDRYTIDNICICYVGSEKEKKLITRDAFGSLPEEEMHKYLKFFKKALSGTMGKNLINLDFPLSEEMQDGKQELLLKLRDSRLDDDAVLESFYDRVIENYEAPDKYCIIIMHAVYDIPGKSRNEELMDDFSDNVYDFILTLVSPVELRDGELGYDPENNRIGELTREWVLNDPDKAFLFPSFNDRTSDIHSVLYYSKKCEELQPDFIGSMFGADPPLTAGDQKDVFNMLVSSVCAEEGDVEVMKNIHDSLTDMIEENKDNPEPLIIGKSEVKKILSESGVTEEKLNSFDKHFDDIAGEDADIVVSNLPGVKKFNISTPDIDIRVNADFVDRVEARFVDGRQCIVIAVDDHVKVNGVDVRTLLPGGRDQGAGTL